MNPVRKLDIRYLHFTAVSSRSLPPPIKAGRFPFAQNLVKISRSLNRFFLTGFFVFFIYVTKIEQAGNKTSRQGGRQIFVIGASIARPRECV